MNNWHHKVIKLNTSFIFIFIFLFSLGFGQIKDSLRKDRIEKELVQYEKQKQDSLISDFQNVNFEKLTDEIINEIAFSKNIRKKNLIFIYEPLRIEQKLLINATDRVPYYNIENPAYNQKQFWTEKSIKKLVKLTKKHLIPQLQINNYFINNSKETQTTIHYFYNKNDELFKKNNIKKKGKFVDFLGKETDFFYFPYKCQQEIVISNIDGKKNYGVINVEFANFIGKIVTIKFIYNDNYEIYKTYQYQNKKWVEIITTEKYKF